MVQVMCRKTEGVSMSDEHLLNENYRTIFGKARAYCDKVQAKVDTELDGHEFYTDGLLAYGKAEYERAWQECENFHYDMRRCDLESIYALQQEIGRIEEEKRTLNQEFFKENAELKEQNKALMRENLQLRNAMEVLR